MSSYKNKEKVNLYPSLSVLCFHNDTLTQDVCTDYPLAAPAIAPVKEEASGSAQMRVMKRRQCFHSATHVQRHYGRRIAVREHTKPGAKTPINAGYHGGKSGIMAAPAFSEESVAVRSGTSVKHTTPIKTPINAVHRKESSIKRERALSHERAEVRSGSSVNSRPFLCRPSMGKSSLHGEFLRRNGSPESITAS